MRVSSRSEIFDSLHPWRLPWCQCVALGEVDLQYPQKNGFRPESPAIAFGTLQYRRSAAVESRSAGRKNSKKIFELEDETVGTAFACDYGLALHENSRASATRASFYLRRTTRRRSAALVRFASLPSRGHARRCKRSGGSKGNVRRANPIRRVRVSVCERGRSESLSAKSSSGRVRSKKSLIY